MTTPQNPYQKPSSLTTAASLEEYVDPMEEESPSSSKASHESRDGSQQSTTQENHQDKVLEIEEEDEPLPPSFQRTITEEILRDGDRPYVFWANIRFPIPEKPEDPVATMFDHLERFMHNMLEADAHFTVFPHNLSEYESIEDLPEPLEDPDQIPGEVEDWLEYFPGARPRARGGFTYTSALLGFHEPFPKVIKTLASWFRKTKFGLWKSSLQSEKPVSLGWLLFSTPTMDVEVLQGEITQRIASIPVGLRWKMISLGTQGSVPIEQQVKALHLEVDELDAALAKPRLMEVYTSKPEPGHFFPLGIRMRLVPELDSILNTKGRANAERLRACQNTWNSEKLAYIKMWEIELLDHYDLKTQTTLRKAMMSLSHPTNNKFALFHTIDRHWLEKCHVLTVLKSAEPQARAMIARMLPYLQWKFGMDEKKKSQIAKWFKPAARARAVDAYWDPTDECVKNTSDTMLTVAMADDDDLYWASEKPPPDPASPKRKRVQLEEESLEDTVSTIKSGLSTKKTRKSALKTSERNDDKTTHSQKDSPTVNSQATSISQLTEQVNEIKQTNKTFLARFDQLAEQMAALLVASQPQTNSQRPAGGHTRGSGHQT